MSEESLPEVPDENNSEENLSEEEVVSPRQRHRRRVRKRIRIKKKSNPKRKLKKYAERLMWLIAIAGFITVLVIFMKQMDIKDPKLKEKKKTSSIYLHLVLFQNSNFTLTQNIERYNSKNGLLI